MHPESKQPLTCWVSGCLIWSRGPETAESRPRFVSPCKPPLRRERRGQDDDVFARLVRQLDETKRLMDRPTVLPGMILVLVPLS